MNKKDEFPYGYHPSKVGLIICILFAWMLAIYEIMDESIILGWIQTIMLFYLLDSTIFLNGYAGMYLIMRDLGDSIPEKGKYLLENETGRYILFALKQAILWPIFLFEKE